jgi:hypothetical protein
MDDVLSPVPVPVAASAAAIAWAVPVTTRRVDDGSESPGRTAKQRGSQGSDPGHPLGSQIYGDHLVLPGMIVAV